MSLTVTAVLLLALAGAEPPAGVDAALEIYARPQHLVRLPDGRRMNLHCTGAGAPTVVFEGGWTTPTAGWRKVQPDVARLTRACSYDRAGYGFSDPGPLSRTAGAEADDLRALLRASGERGPYVLVAHSMGGLVARLFVDRNRRDVAGLVLVDPSSPRQDARLAAVSAKAGETNALFESGFKACARKAMEGAGPDPATLRDCVDPPASGLPASVNTARRASQLTPAYQRTALSELESMGVASSAEVDRSRRSWGRLPLVVLTAERTTDDPRLPADERAALARVWSDMHQEAADLSSTGRRRMLAGASHMVPSQRPEAVVEAVREVVEEVRGRSR